MLYWDKPGEHYNETFECDMCHQTRNMPVQRYERMKRTHQPLLCNECNAAAEEADREVSAYKAVCSKCGNHYEVSKYAGWKISKGFQDPICPDCSRTVTAVCSACGKTFSTQKYKVAEAKENYKGIMYCPECRRRITVKCEKCGRSYEMMEGAVRRLKARHIRLICPNCAQKKKRSH